MLKPFHRLKCDNLEIIQQKVLSFIDADLKSYRTGWIFINTKELFQQIPELVEYFKSLKLKPREASVTILYDDFPIHVDTLPVVAKINIPISNTQGWSNRWYHIEQGVLESCPDVVDHLGFTKKDVSGAVDKMILKGEVLDQSDPIVFNSSIPHSVIKLNPTHFPRVVLSITVFNEPLELLK